MYLVQSDALKVFKDVESLSSSSFKRALGTSALLSFADDEFDILINFLKKIDEDYKVIVDVPMISTSPVVISETDPSKIITYDEYIGSGKPESKDFADSLSSDDSDE